MCSYFKKLRMAQIALLLTVVGCAADPEDVRRVADEEADRLIPPSRALSTFAGYELAPMTIAEAIEAHEGKAAEAAELEEILQAKLSPLLAEWNKQSRDGKGTLQIEPALQRLRVVGGVTRFFGGLFTGGSFVDMDVLLVEKDSGELIAKVRIYRDASALAGAISIGKSDQNLDEYIVSIVHEYLVDSY